MEEITSAKWQPFKDLLETTERFALNKANTLHALKLLLRRHKPDFLSLLKNQTRNADSKAAIQKHIGVSVQGNMKVIDANFVDEALIISELFELNELISFDLLVAGEQQKPNYTNYSRGLVAVMLYWDGKRNLSSALRTLIQCRKGKVWTLELTEDSAALATSFTDELLANGLTQQILKMLQSIQVETELEKLANRKGLGDARHRRQVRDLIVEVRQNLADCLFCFACQSGLPKDDVIAIIEYLSQNAEVDCDRKLSSTTAAVLFSLLYSIKSPISTSADEDEEELLKQSLICEEDFMVPIHKALADEESEWKVPGIRACALFAWSLSLRSISQSTLSNSFNLEMNNMLEQDEFLMESALADKVFLFMEKNIVLAENFHNEEFYVRLFHHLITDLIVNMPLKVKEMRNHGDEVARIVMLHLVEGEEAPSELRKDFQHFMELITAIYDKDPLNLQLSTDFWCFPDQAYFSDISLVTSLRMPQKQATLFKFVRQSGDVLPPLLYIPYLHMLSALSTGPGSARAAFELLRANGGNGDGLISWDHFFMSCHRYFDNLREDKLCGATNPFMALQTPLSSGVPAKTCTITPQEIDGLRAVMRLSAKIAQYDDIACLAFYEDNHWCACGVLFGLLQCPVPIQLKGDILLVLAQLCRLSGVGPGILQASEHAQILIKQSGTDKLCNIATELEEMESRDEEYPLTRGFLKLLSVLADSRVDSLGEIFQKYLAFVVDSVFLRVLTRAYARPEEKWEVAGPCLDLFNKILSQYRPQAEDFVDEKSFFKLPDDPTMPQHKPAAKHPGMTLLRYLYNEGNFFKIVMKIIYTCITYFDSYVTKSALEHTLVEATEQSLQLLLHGMQLQEPFLEMLRNSGNPLMVTALDKLVLGMNPETKKADYVITLARFVRHSSTHPRLSLLAVEILSWLCSSSAHRQVVTLMINSCDEKMRQEVVHGFVEILDTNAPEELEGASQNLIAREREAILRLMTHCVDQPSPNFCHILLGIDLKKQPSHGNLQDPGVMGSSRSCLHSILSILCTADEQQPPAIVETPQLAELCFHLIYRLASNPESSEPVLRYLRSSCDFLYKHLQYLPFQTDELSTVVLMQQSWLLKTTAIELHVLASRQQRTNVQRLIQVLFSQPPSLNETTTPLISQSFNQSDRSRLADVSLQSMSILKSTSKPATTKLAMLELFDLVDLHQSLPSPLILDQFVLSLVEDGIRSCETNNEHGVVFCDIKVLHNLLESNVNTLASEDVNRKRLASQDVQNILRTVVQRNQVRSSMHSKLHFLTSWKQVLEIMLTSCPEDVLMKATRQQVVFIVLQHLVTAGCDVEASQDLTSSLAPAVLTLSMQIRSSMTTGKGDSSFSSQDDLPQDTINLLLTFQVVIQGIIEWLLQSGVNQKARISLYAALLHYMQLCRQTKHLGPDSSEHVRLRSLREDVHTRLTRENVRLFREFGDSFKTLLCKDAFTGHSICRVLAFGCLDSILQIDNEHLWLQFMLNNGYVNHIANSFAEEDQALQESLHPSSLPSRTVYIFEQKMALLCSIVHTPGGARAIINSQILPELAKCDFLEMRPPAEYAADPASMTALARYRQLLFPVLHLCTSLLNTLGGPTHYECCAVVLQFTLSHSQSIVTSVLRSNTDDQQSLMELCLVSGILCQVAGQDFTNTALYPDIPQVVLMEIQGHLLLIQRQLMKLLPNFLITEEVMNNLKTKVEDPKTYEKTVLLLHEIASNLLTYCRVMVTQSADADSTLLFSCELAESSFGRTPYGNEIYRKPSMGILIKFLQTTLARYTSEMKHITQIESKFENINQLTSQDLKEILGPGTDVVQLTVAQEQKLALIKLQESIASKTKLTKCLLYIIETTLFLLWHHLQIYASQVVSIGKTREKLLFPANSSFRNSPRRLQDISNVSTPEKVGLHKIDLSPIHIDQLKNDVQSSLTDSFLKKLSSVESEGSFVQPLVRRMQSIKLQLN